MAGKRMNENTQNKIIKRKRQRPKLIFKSKLILIILLIASMYAVGSLGKFTMNAIQESYLQSKGFYFSSNFVKEDQKYTLNNWDGQSSYSFMVSLTNSKNDAVWTQEDISYTVTTQTSEGITCAIADMSNGTLKTKTDRKTENTIGFTIASDNTKTFKKDDSVTVTVVIQSTAPYTKTLKATFEIKVTSLDLNYYIIDTEESEYATLYLSSNINTNKVKITPDTSKVVIDNTNYYIQNNESIQTTVNSEGENEITSFDMIIQQAHVYAFRFYKKDKSKNYTNDSTAINIERATD